MKKIITLIILLLVVIAIPASGLDLNKFRYGNRKIKIPLTSSLTEGNFQGSPTFSRSTSNTYYDTSGVIQTANTNIPRFQRNDGVVIEGTRTNLIFPSEDFSSVNWTEIYTTVTVDQSTAPDNTVTADKITESSDSVARYHDIYTNTAKSASALVHTFTVYAKYIGRHITLMMKNAADTAGVYAAFNLQNGTVIKDITTYGTGWTARLARIEAIGNGWYRCVLVGVSDTNTTIKSIIRTNASDTEYLGQYIGDGRDAFYIWGAQLEQAPEASYYKKTTTAAVTTNDDTLTYPTAGNLKPNNFSIYLEYTPNHNATATSGDIQPHPFLSYVDSNNYVKFFLNNDSGGKIGWYYINAGVSAALYKVAQYTAGTKYKMLITYSRVNGKTFYLNGVKVASDTNTNDMPIASTFSIGGDSSHQKLFGAVKNLTIYHRALSEQEAIKLTTP